jgi:hypothetical protein
VAAGYPRTTPVLLGEWSRFIPAYAMGGPGAAFLACCLATINSLHPLNSQHAVEDSFVFSAGKVWDGKRPAAPNLHAGVLWQVWESMVKTAQMLNTSVTVGGGPADDKASTCCEFHAVAASDGADTVRLLLANYNSTADDPESNALPSVGALHEVAVQVRRVISDCHFAVQLKRSTALF